MVPAHGVTTILYLLEKARDAAFARVGVERLIGVFGVAPVDDNDVRSRSPGLTSRMPCAQQQRKPVRATRW